MSAITSYNGLNVKGALVVTGAKSTLAVHAAAYAGLNIPSAATVITTPVSGDIWNLSGVLQFHNGTSTIQVVDTAASQSIAGTKTFTGQVVETQGTIGTPTLKVNAVAGSAADSHTVTPTQLIEWRNSGGTLLGGVTPAGSVFINANSGSDTGFLFPATSQATHGFYANGNDIDISPYFDLIFAPFNSTGRVRPSADITSDLGTSSLRWKTLWSLSATLAAGTTALAPLNIAHGVAPTAPVNGDIWTTTAGIFVRVNGSTVGPLGTGGGGGTPATTVTTLTGLQVAAVGTATNYAREDHAHGIAGLVDTSTTQSAIAGAKTFTANLTVNSGSNAGNATVGRMWIGDAGGTPSTWNGPTLAGGGLLFASDASWRLWAHNGTTPTLVFSGSTSSVTSWASHQFLTGFANFAGFGGATTATMAASGATSLQPATDVVPLTIVRGTDTSPTAHFLDLKNHNSILMAYFDVGASLYAPSLNATSAGITSSATSGITHLTGSTYSADSSGAGITLQKSRNATPGSFTVLQNNDIIGALSFQGSGTTGFKNAAYIRAEVDGATISDTSMPTRLIVTTTPSGSVVPVERLRIDNAGTTTQTLTTDVTGLIVKGSASQTQDLLVVQNSSAVALANVGYEGSAHFTNLASVNYFRNGDFQVNQRNIAATSTGVATNTYMLDGWIVNATTAAITCSQNDNGVYSGSPSRYGLLLTGAASNTAVSVAQRIEARDAMQLGRVCNITLWTYNNTGAAMTAPTITFSNPTTTADVFSALTSTGTTSMTLVSGTNAAGAAWLQWSLGIDFTGLGSTIVRGQEIKFNFQALTAGKSIILASARFEIGSKTSSYLPEPYQQAFDRCLRYYWRYTTVTTSKFVAVGHSTATTTFTIHIPAPVPMRAAPTMAVSSGAGFIVTNSGGSGVACTAVSNNTGGNEYGGQVNGTVASGLVAGQGTILATSATGTNWIEANAEL